MNQKPAPRGATPLATHAVSSRRRHVLLVLCCAALLGVFTLTLSTPQNAALAPALEDQSVAEEIASSAATPEPEAAPVEPEAPPWQDFTVADGDNLSLIFSRAGYSDNDLFRVAQASESRSLRKIFPGEVIGFLASETGELIALRHVQSPLKHTEYRLTDQGFVAETQLREPDRLQRAVSLEINSSLFLAGSEAGLSDATIMELAGIFGGVIDFVLDPRTGDEIHVVFEELYLDGERFADGPILATSFTNRGEVFEAFRYTDLEGDTGYYNASGVSMRKAFLRAPLDFTRVSSNFNPNRLHPIYKTERPHRGTDYAAPRGTPVYAAGDGRVVEAGYTRANGNYVFIQHGEQFETHYLHLHRLKVKQGARVKQGEVIGTVGSTGAATGPHLHYEFMVNGVHRNPRTVHKILPKARSLPEAELLRYQQSIHQPLEQLASLRSERQLALAE